MPPITTQATSTNHGLPDDIFDLSHDHFYQFIEKQYGIDLSELFRFQSIRSGNHVLQASLDDILSILNEDSIHLDRLKKLCCFEVAGSISVQWSLAWSWRLEVWSSHWKSNKINKGSGAVVQHNKHRCYRSMVMVQSSRIQIKLKTWHLRSLQCWLHQWLILHRTKNGQCVHRSQLNCLIGLI